MHEKVKVSGPIIQKPSFDMHRRCVDFFLYDGNIGRKYTTELLFC